MATKVRSEKIMSNFQRKETARTYSREYYKKDPAKYEARKLYQRQYYQANKKRCQERVKDWQMRNSELVRRNTKIRYDRTRKLRKEQERQEKELDDLLESMSSVEREVYLENNDMFQV